MNTPPVVAVLANEPAVRASLERFLRSAGFNVHVHADTLEFLDGISQERPDVLVLDLGSPEMDGASVMRVLKAGGMQSSVIILTTEYASAVRARPTSNPAVMYLVKPVNDRDFIEALKLAVAQSRLSRDF